MFRGGGAGGGGGRFLRMPPSRWSGGGGGRHHPYRGPQDHRAGGGPGFRTGPGGFGGGFRGMLDSYDLRACTLSCPNFCFVFVIC